MSLPLAVTLEQYAFFHAQTPEKFQPDRLPVFIHYGNPAGSRRVDYYGFPIFGHTGVKVGEHHAGPIVTADTRTFEVDAQRLRRLSDYVRTTLPATNGEVLQAATCLYTNTPDQHFIIDQLPGSPACLVWPPGFPGTASNLRFWWGAFWRTWQHRETPLTRSISLLSNAFARTCYKTVEQASLCLFHRACAQRKCRCTE